MDFPDSGTRHLQTIEEDNINYDLISGASGLSGVSGLPGASGLSGLSGLPGASGLSGLSLYFIFSLKRSLWCLRSVRIKWGEWTFRRCR